MKTYAIGDIHGRYDLAYAAVKAIRQLEGTEPGDGYRLLFLGDYVDRGPESAKVIAFLMGMQAAHGTDAVVCLKGNHEDMMFSSLHSISRTVWMNNGGGATLASYEGREIPPAHIEWMNKLPLMFVQPHRVYVHAAVDPTRPLDQQREQTLLWQRYYDKDNVGHGPIMDADNDADEQYERHVVHGHTPQRYGPELLRYRTNLDTGAVFTGVLTVGVFDEDKPGGPTETFSLMGSADA